MVKQSDVLRSMSNKKYLTPNEIARRLIIRKACFEETVQQLVHNIHGVLTRLYRKKLIDWDCYPVRARKFKPNEVDKEYRRRRK